MAEYKNPYLDQANPYLGANPQLQGQIDAAQSDLTNSYNMTTQPAYNSAMVKSGSFGNSGVQQMNENAQSNLQKNLGRVSSDMRNQDYLNQQNMYKWDRDQNSNMYRWDQEFGRNTFNDAFSQNQSTAQLGMNWLGQLNGYNQQDLANATTIQNTPLNYYGQFANTANAAGGMGGTSTIQQGTSSSPMTAALGGAQLGSTAMNYWNQRPAPLNNNNDSSWASGNSYGGVDYGASSGGDYGQFY